MREQSPSQDSMSPEVDSILMIEWGCVCDQLLDLAQQSRLAPLKGKSAVELYGCLV